MMRLVLFLALLGVAACSWEPLAGPHEGRLCHRVYAETLHVWLDSLPHPDTIRLGACR